MSVQFLVQTLFQINFLIIGIEKLMSTLMSSMELKKKQGHCFILKLFSGLRVTNSLSQTQQPVHIEHFFPRHIVLFPKH